MNRLVLLALTLSLSGCFDFDKAYGTFCEGGRCKADASISGGGNASGGGTSAGGSSAGGTSTGAGGGVASSGGGAESGGGAATGGGSATGGGTTVGGGTTTGGGVSTDGGVTDAGSMEDAGTSCAQWGSTCTAEGQCCSTSDAGRPMACSRSSYCLEVPADCRGGDTTCAFDAQCCSNRCESGRCTFRSSSDACLTAANCREGYTCVAGSCSSDMSIGALCNTSDSCRNTTKWCNFEDAGIHNGVCATPVNGCGELGSILTTNCCPGLVYVPSGTNAGCRLPQGEWCYYSSSCESGNCVGDRCTSYSDAPAGGRCNYSNECSGNTLVCDQTTLVCTTRWCIPPGLNTSPFSGCCNLTAAGLCVFADNTSCKIGNTASGTASTCCSGDISNGYCTGVTLFP